MADELNRPAHEPASPPPSPPSSPPTSPPAASRRRAWHPWRWLGGSLLLLVLLVGAAIGGVVWALTTPAGTAWALSLVPGVSVTAPQGALIGDFSAERIEANVPGTGDIRLDAPRWQGLSIARGDHGRWLRLHIDSLHVERVVFAPSTAAKPASAPPALPDSLRLPIEVVIGDASIGEFRFGGADAVPVRDIHAAIHLGAEGGAVHSFEALRGAYDKGQASGSARIAADAPFAVGLRVGLAGIDSTPSWQARLVAEGPLAALDVTATARVDATTTHAAQSLDARAIVKPFAAWPLGELRASTSALDLSAFASAAPATALSGEAVATTSAIDQPAVVSLRLDNARAGRYDEGLLPLRSLRAELRARPDHPSVLEVQTLSADLGSAQAPAGRIVASGRWAPERATFAIELQQVRPSLLDGRAPQASLAGSVSIVGTGLASGPPESRAVEIVADIVGQLLDPAVPRAAPREAKLKLSARLGERAIDLRSFDAVLGDARATLSGKLTRSAADAPWRAAGKMTVVDFDPVPWWPGAKDTPLARGTNRINADADFDLVLPSAAPTGSPFDALNALRGEAALSITRSAIAGVPFAAEAAFVNQEGRARPSFDVVVAGNHLSGQGRLAAAGSKRDEWQVSIDAPQLGRLAPLLADAGAATGADKPPAVAGTLSAKASVNGRWPDVTSEGELRAAALRYGGLTLRQADGRWRVGSADNARIDASLSIDDLQSEGRTIERIRAKLDGTARAHRAEVRIESQALPPEWVDTLMAEAAARGVAVSASAGAAPRAAATAASAAASTATNPATPNGRSELLLTAAGGLVEAGGEPAAGWRGRLVELVARSVDTPRRTWLQVRDVSGSVFWAGGPLRVDVQPGRAEALGATLRWKRIAYRGASGRAADARLDLEATIDPIAVAPILRRLQPDFGWDGDLEIGARIEVHSNPAITAEIVVERTRGDLVVAQDFGRQKLGLSDLRFGIDAKAGVWNATVAMAGSTLGVASGAVTARTGSGTAWPEASTPIEGVLELRVADLGSWGTWVPAGWRLGGRLHASASIGGRLGAPSYTGRLEGSKLTARNFLQGINVTDGELAVALEGETARIERFVVHGGQGTARLTGEARLGETPTANLALTADAFELLGRVDRRIVASGKATMRLDAKTIALSGGFKVDEGLIDFTRADAPTLGDDVVVVRRPGGGASPAAESKALAAARVDPPAGRDVKLDLRINVGEKLRIRGRGLDASLRGELHITSPGGNMRVEGSIRAVDGTYQAYGQKLAINRAVITFNGPIDNPRLDIEATRPDLDEVRVGVVVTGTVLNPRVRLFSEPELSDVDKLSWLVLGKPATSTGGAESALLQRAALALLSGEGPGAADKVTRALGLDEFSVRSGAGGVTDTIVSVGKQISDRWYVGYEQGLNSTTGSWQLIYRIARRFTVKAQAGGDNAIDVNWTLRWK